MHIANLLSLSAGLGITPAELLQPLPGLEGPAEERRLYAEFCWDRLYPDIHRFLVALAAVFAEITSFRRELLSELDRHLSHGAASTLSILVRRIRKL